MPLPPDTVSATWPSGATMVAAGVRLTPAPTVMVVVALLCNESVVVTTSVVEPTAPAT